MKRTLKRELKGTEIAESEAEGFDDFTGAIVFGQTVVRLCLIISILWWLWGHYFC